MPDSARAGPGSRLKINSDNAEQVAEINDNIKEFKYAMSVRGSEVRERLAHTRTRNCGASLLCLRVCVKVKAHLCETGRPTPARTRTRTHLPVCACLSSAVVCLAAHEVKINF